MLFSVKRLPIGANLKRIPSVFRRFGEIRRRLGFSDDRPSPVFVSDRSEECSLVSHRTPSGDSPFGGDVCGYDQPSGLFGRRGGGWNVGVAVKASGSSSGGAGTWPLANCGPVSGLIWTDSGLFVTGPDAGIGTSIDSFYEYLLMAYLLFGDDEYLFIFQEAYSSVMYYLYNDPWSIWIRMLLYGHYLTIYRHFGQGFRRYRSCYLNTYCLFSVWKRYGFTPEGFNLAALSVQHGLKSYPLRPELIESIYLDVGRDIIASLQYGARCPCGYCHISDIENHKSEDHMESFFLAETHNIVLFHSNTYLCNLRTCSDEIFVAPFRLGYTYIHRGPLVASDNSNILLQEHCSYFGGYCNRGYLKEESRASDKSADSQETNGSIASEGWVRTALPLDSSSFEASSLSGLIKDLCPGLTLAQKYGISYLALVDTLNEDSSSKQDTVVQSHAIVFVSDQLLISHYLVTVTMLKNQLGRNPRVIHLNREKAS
ncbi:Detected protein of confused Function [Hibiscus syriacus]|uniref:Detected protein of confused Function n=1 Tax=Hibiscus syriacus TaxID=106335 RepID=A0A6A3CSQ9_HIBSY|nr:Detected protein of confused Function [Hibiscus syriacus]